MNTADLIDACKAIKGYESDYRFAKAFGISTQTVSQWRSGVSYPGLDRLFTLALVAGLQPQEVLAELEFDRASRAGDERRMGIWQNLKAKVHDSAHGALGALLGTVIVSALFAASPEAQATALTRPAALHNGPSVYYVNRRWRGWLARLGRAARNLIPSPSALQLVTA